MGARTNIHNDPPTEVEQRREVEKQIVRTEFARRLNAVMLKNGWSQSEFARRAAAQAKKQKIEIRVGPDSISHWLRGRYLPSPAALKLIADTLGLDDVRDLLPTKGIPEAGESLPPIGVQDMNNGTAWMKVNQAVPWAVALKILALLKGEED